MSKKYYYEDCCYPQPHPPVPPAPLPPCPPDIQTPIGLKCGQGTPAYFSGQNTRAQLAFLELNTEKYPTNVVKLDFSSVIETETLIDVCDLPETDIGIRFILARENSNGVIIELENWIYRRARTEGAPPTTSILNSRAESYSFTYCDKITCYDCYVYRVFAEVTIGASVRRVNVFTTQFNAIVGLCELC